MFRSGFVNIIGKPNVGKSTLLNAMMGEKLAIVSPKAQTTRHRIVGVLHGDQYQIVFSDTPGYLKPAYKMQQSMLGVVKNAFKDADVFLFITDMEKKVQQDDPVIWRLNETDVPIIAVLNKIDLSDQSSVKKAVEQLGQLLPSAHILPASALHNYNMDYVLHKIIEALPEGPPYYPPDVLTDRPERFFVSEIIREKIFLLYKQEIPYCCQVEIDAYQEEQHITHIRAIIHVSKDSQKAILIGKGGGMLKSLGMVSRREIEAFLDKKIYLELFVKVSKDWRNKEDTLRKFGYIN